MAMRLGTTGYGPLIAGLVVTAAVAAWGGWTIGADLGSRPPASLVIIVVSAPAP